MIAQQPNPAHDQLRDRLVSRPTLDLALEHIARGYDGSEWYIMDLTGDIPANRGDLIGKAIRLTASIGDVYIYRVRNTKTGTIYYEA